MTVPAVDQDDRNGMVIHYSWYLDVPDERMCDLGVV